MDIKVYLIIFTVIFLAACPGTPSGLIIDNPEGFAVANVRAGELYSAVSPEGIFFSVKTENNYPLKDIDFWREALKNQFDKNGYQLYKEEELYAGSNKGVLFEWLAPYSGSTYIYLTYITVNNDKIIIAEAAGEVNLFKEYREAITESIKTISLTGKAEKE